MSGTKADEALDIRAVHAWLSTIVLNLEGTPEVTQYSGGASNWTYRLRYANRDLVLRRGPAGTKAKSAHDMAREFSIQQKLKAPFPLVPTMVGLCTDPSVIGADFYVMERIDGLIPRKKMPPGCNLSERDARKLCLTLIDTLVDLHRVDIVGANLESIGRGRGYVRRQVDGWSDRYEKARTWNVPSFKHVRAWLKANAPDDVGHCVIHNDWRFDNVVLAENDPTRIVGVLDWELATIGDPLMDLGSALAYWVQADDDPFMRSLRRQPTHLPGMLRREEVVEYYLDRAGMKTDNWKFYEIFGLFRVATIAQQIYFRYHHKQTRNPAFKYFWTFVNYCAWRCGRIVT